MGCVGFESIESLLGKFTYKGKGLDEFELSVILIYNSVAFHIIYFNMLKNTSLIIFTLFHHVLGLTILASDSHSANGAALAGDGNTGTFWHSQYTPTLISLPHWATVDLGTPTFINGLNYLPRQDGSSNGNIGQYKIEVSPNNAAWTQVASGTLLDDNSKKYIGFPAVTTSKLDFPLIK